MKRLSFAPLLCIGILAGCSSQAPVTAPPTSPVATPRVEPVRSEPRFPKPEHVRGVYVTAWKAGSQRLFASMLKMLARTEINAIVIDVRDAGHVYFDLNSELARSSGALTVGVAKPERLFQQLDDANLYPIARIACFRDDFVPRFRPDLAVQVKDGRPWKDGSGHTWLDPYNRANWDYMALIVDKAMDLGFQEIQLDYVRFPSEGNSKSQVFPSATKQGKDEVIGEFAKFICERVRTRGIVVTADIFGIISSTKSDQGIGQTLEKVAEPFDVICPMVYPSHFAKGEYDVPDPNLAPYKIVSKSMADFKTRLPGKAIRPWLQDFSLGAGYGKKEVRAQIRAARELGYQEYLLWNPSGRYTEAAITDNSDLKELPAKPRATKS